MNAALTPEAVISALAVMGEARQALAGRPREHRLPADFEIAERIAVAEGRLREQLMQALPKNLELAA